MHEAVREGLVALSLSLSLSLPLPPHTHTHTTHTHNTHTTHTTHTHNTHTHTLFIVVEFLKELKGVRKFRGFELQTPYEGPLGGTLKGNVGSVEKVNGPLHNNQQTSGFLF